MEYACEGRHEFTREKQDQKEKKPAKEQKNRNSGEDILSF